ncbi:MAG: inositol monophosphatase family protein [Candidatus Kapaibacteriales bacterium]
MIGIGSSDIIDIKRKLIVEAAKEAGKLQVSGFNSTMSIIDKDGTNNIVTEYDFKVEKSIIDRIKKSFPNHSIIAEESGKSLKSDDNLWIIDPIDGTVNFSKGIPVFCVSLAYMKMGEIILGCIFNPITNELFFAEKGEGAFLNGKEIKVSDKEVFSNSLLATGFPYKSEDGYQKILSSLNTIIAKGIPIRRMGSAAIDLAYTACGRFDGFWENGLNPWDVAAGILLVEEAGGKVLNNKLMPFDMFEDEVIFAGNPMIIEDLINAFE